MHTADLDRDKVPLVTDTTRVVLSVRSAHTHTCQQRSGVMIGARADAVLTEEGLLEEGPSRQNQCVGENHFA